MSSSAIFNGLDGYTIDSDGARPHGEVGELPSVDTDFYALKSRLGDSSLEALSAFLASLQKEANEQGIEVSQSELEKSFPLVNFEVPNTFAPDSTIHVTKFQEDEEAPKDETEASTRGERSFDGAYLTKIFFDHGGEVAGMISAPVPYVHGNAIFVARSDAFSLVGLDADMLQNPELTKRMLQELTGAVKVVHQGDPDRVQTRVKAALVDMPVETFKAGSRQRQAFYEQAYDL